MQGEKTRDISHSDMTNDEERATTYLKEGKLNQAKEIYQKLINIFPKEAKFRFNLSLVYYKQKKYHLALDKVIDGLKLAPEDQKALKFKHELEKKIHEKSLQNQPEKNVDMEKILSLPEKLNSSSEKINAQSLGIKNETPEIIQDDGSDSGSNEVAQNKEEEVKDVSPTTVSRLVSLREIFDNQTCDDGSEPPCQDDAYMLNSDVVVPKVPKQYKDPKENPQLVNFETYSDLENYKTSIEDIVEKYVEKKVETDQNLNIEIEEETEAFLVDQEDNTSILNTELRDFEGIYYLNDDFQGDSYQIRINPLDRFIVEENSNNSSLGQLITKHINYMNAYRELIRKNREGGMIKGIDIDYLNVEEQEIFMIYQGSYLGNSGDFQPYSTLNDILSKDNFKRDEIAAATPINIENYPNVQNHQGEDRVDDLGEISTVKPKPVPKPPEEVNLNKILEKIENLATNIPENMSYKEIQRNEAATKIKLMARKFYDNAQYHDAIKIYKRYLDVLPEDFEALFNLGFCYRELDKFEESANTFMKILEVYYDNAYAWYNLGIIYAIIGDGEKELYALQRARDFGYVVDFQRLSRLAASYTPKNPFGAFKG